MTCPHVPLPVDAVYSCLRLHRSTSVSILLSVSSVLYLIVRELSDASGIVVVFPSQLSSSVISLKGCKNHFLPLEQQIIACFYEWLQGWVPWKLLQGHLPFLLPTSVASPNTGLDQFVLSLPGGPKPNT